MKKRLNQKQGKTLLPIVGDSVVAVCVSVDRDPEIVVADAVGRQSSIELSDRFTIGRGTHLRTVESRAQQNAF